MKRSRILIIAGISVIVLLIGIVIGSVAFPRTKTSSISSSTTTSQTNTNNENEGSSQSYLTTFTRSCTGAIVFCGITSAVATGSTTTVVVYQFVNSNSTQYYTQTLSHVPQIYSTDSTTTIDRVLFSNSSTTSYYDETLYHVVLSYSTTYTVKTDNTTSTVLANFGGVSGPRFELQEFSLAAYNSFLHASYLFGYVVFNSTVAPTSIQYLVNGTGGDPQPFSRPSDVPAGENYTDVWKSGGGYNLVAGHVYTITFIVTYEDGISQSESIVLTAN